MKFELQQIIKQMIQFTDFTILLLVFHKSIKNNVKCILRVPCLLLFSNKKMCM